MMIEHHHVANSPTSTTNVIYLCVELEGVRVNIYNFQNYLARAQSTNQNIMFVNLMIYILVEIVYLNLATRIDSRIDRQ